MTILFLHGLASSGAYKLANMLRIHLKADVVAPDQPLDPAENIPMLQALMQEVKPDAVIGHSWGGFMALQLGAPVTVVINPALYVSGFLRERIGPMRYLSPRRDGATEFPITEEICDRFEQLEKAGFPPQGKLLGCFAQDDELLHYADEFESLFPGCSFSYPGGHLPTFLQVKTLLAPAILDFLEIPHQ